MSEESNHAEPAQADDGNDPGAATTAAAEALRREADEHRERSLRLAAELDNFRKRSAREVDAARKFGAERLAQALLPVRDSLEAGLKAAGAEGGALREGQEATLRLLDEALTQAGVRAIDPHGEPFDPAKHEALSLVPAPNVEPNTVVEVIQKGYELNDRLLRPARVLVSKA